MTETAAEPRRFDVGSIGLDDDDVAASPESLSQPARLDNPLDSLRAAITGAVQKPDLVLEVASRPGVAIRFATAIDYDHVSRWRKRATDKSQPDDFNLLMFSCLVLANTCRAVSLRGQEPTGADGRPLTFISRELSEWTGQRRHIDIVRALYGSDGHVVATAEEIMQAAGYGDDIMEADDLDPTGRS